MNTHIRNRRFVWSVLLPLVATGLAQAQTPPSEPPPMDPNQAINAAIQAIETGDLQTADKLIRDVSASNPKMSRLNLANGMLLMELKRYTESIEAFGLYNATDEGRRDYRGWAAVGSVYLESYMYSSAIGSLEKALELAPASEKEGAIRAKIALDLARTHLGLNDKKDAMESIRTAQTSAPQNGDIQMQVCSLAARAGDTETARAAGNAAIRAFNSELSVNPLSLSAHRGLGQCFQVLLGIQTAELSKDPNNGAAFIEGARLLRSIAEIERRIRLLDARSLVIQALETNPTSVDWQLFAAEVELDLGATGEAEARVDAILQTDSNNANAQALKKRLTSSAG